MSAIPMGIFFILHGVVHFLYLGQSRRLFELQPGMIWPDGSWSLSRLLGDDTTRLLAAVALALAGGGFIVGGVGIMAGWAWWRSLVVGVSIFSSLLYLLLWNGKMEHLDNQGAVGILLNLAILAAVLILHWPTL